MIDFSDIEQKKADKELVEELLERLTKVEEIIDIEQEEPEDSFDHASSEDRDEMNDIMGESLDKSTSNDQQL
jgi:hypothetical protein